MIRAVALGMSVVVLSVVFVLASCGNDDASATPGRCTAIYAEGARVTDAVTSGECIDRDGTLLTLGATRYVCPDGSEIGWNDLGWWADGVVRQYSLLAERVAPASFRERCDTPLIP